jgi:hypothetical protein
MESMKSRSNGVSLGYGWPLGLALVLSWSSPAAALSCRAPVESRAWYLPAYARAQTGGYLGALTIGAGYTPWRVLELGAYYGWVPEQLGGVHIHSVALRVGARVRGICVTPDWNWIYVTGGVTALFTRGEGFFVSVPERYDDSRYYRPTGVRGLLSVGTALSHRDRDGSILSTQGPFLEISALDEYLRLWAKSPHAEPFLSTLSTSVGYQIGFH